MADTQKFERFTEHTGTVADFISEAFSEITSLGEEFREIYDNAPENLQQTSLNQTRDTTASEIEGYSEPEVSNDILSNLECSARLDNGKVYRGRQTQSRACRASNAAAMFRAAAEAVESWLGENDELPDADDEDEKEEREERLKELKEAGIEEDTYKDALENAQELIDACNELADEIENLEFPGMFG